MRPHSDGSTLQVTKELPSKHSSPSVALPGLLKPGIRLQVINTVADLEFLVAPWQALARSAVDSNVFYEPWMLLPSLRHLVAESDMLFLLMFAPDPDRPTGPELLCGFFPFERQSNFRGIPCVTLRLLCPLYNRLCTPLVHREFVAEGVTALLDWLAQGTEKPSLIEFRFMNGEGRVAQELHQQIHERGWMAFQSSCTTRALLKPAANAESYFESALRGIRRKEFRRLEKRLSDLGPTEYRALALDGDAKPWITAFLDLESRGWKGEEGTSLSSQTETRRFFEETATEAHRHGQLMMLGLFHQDRPIALKCNYLSGAGSFAFKIAYDETFKSFSPGVLLELENIRRFHQMPQLAWMDSTADDKHFMINRLWIDRRTIETLLVSPHRIYGDLVIAILPFLRLIKSAPRRWLSL